MEYQTETKIVSLFSNKKQNENIIDKYNKLFNLLLEKVENDYETYKNIENASDKDNEYKLIKLKEELVYSELQSFDTITGDLIKEINNLITHKSDTLKIVQKTLFHK